jgi:UDP:flavonoid glycosyltransferase YjiC (YdhE family)
MPALERFLAAGPRPVYVGFGSMPRRDQARLLPLVTAAGRAVGRRLVVGQFWGDTSGVSDAGNVFTIRRFPHDQLFPRMAAAVHHGGAGTTATAAISGVPQVIVPHILDQYYWGERVYRAGLGPPPVWRSRLTADRLADAVHHALSRPAHRNAAQRVSRQIRHSDGAETALRAIIASL